MSFKAALKIGTHYYYIKNVSYGLLQTTDETGRPSTQVRGGKIEVTITYPRDTFFFELMVSNFETINGSIIYYKRDNDAVLKEVFFREAYIVKYNEVFQAEGKRPLFQKFVISAREIQIGEDLHINDWF